MVDSYAQYKFFKGERKCPFSSYEESYLWCIEKDCYKYNLSVEEQHQRVKSCLLNFEDRIGVVIAYPY